MFGEHWAPMKAVVYLILCLVAVSALFYGLDKLTRPQRFLVMLPYRWGRKLARYYRGEEEEELGVRSVQDVQWVGPGTSEPWPSGYLAQRVRGRGLDRVPLHLLIHTEGSKVARLERDPDQPQRADRHGLEVKYKAVVASNPKRYQMQKKRMVLYRPQCTSATHAPRTGVT